MTLTIPISPEAEERLKAKAAAAGMDVVTYAARELERSFSAPRSIGEISGPAYEEFLHSGMTDDELGDLLEQAKHAMRAERRSKRGA
jgi:hypothetical protein